MKARTSSITLCISARSLLALVLVGAFGLIATGCGGDDEDDPATQVQTQTTPTAAEPVTTPPPETTTPDKPKTDPDTEPRTVPEEEQQGDEEAIRSEAVFTGKGGEITPRKIQVPAFIAIRVILRNADGGSYSIEINGDAADRRARQADGRAGARRPPAAEDLRGAEPAGRRGDLGDRGARPIVKLASWPVLALVSAP